MNGKWSETSENCLKWCKKPNRILKIAVLYLEIHKKFIPFHLLAQKPRKYINLSLSFESSALLTFGGKKNNTFFEQTLTQTQPLFEPDIHSCSGAPPSHTHTHIEEN